MCSAIVYLFEFRKNAMSSISESHSNLSFCIFDRYFPHICLNEFFTILCSILTKFDGNILFLFIEIYIKKDIQLEGLLMVKRP